MIRAAIYARYSTDLQREESIEDQLEACKRYCKMHNFDVVSHYSDAKTSGASTIGREGYEDLCHDAKAGKFDVVVAESVDRFARRLADVATLNDELAFLGIKLHTISNGELTPLLIGVMGGVAQDFLAQIRSKTIRGQRGKILSGLSAGGIAYGYRQVAGSQKGERVIEPYEAEIVKRIFTSYANGMAPRTIATELNNEGIPGPKNKVWSDTTIRGQVRRGTGLLNNALYNGMIIWNRCSYVKNPQTGKRVARPNPESEWETAEAEDLRIVSPELWAKVKQRQQAVTTEMARDDHGNALNRAHRRKHLLSGLIKCGKCGSPFVMIGGNSYGCTNARSKGICKNKISIKRPMFEQHILDALKHKMLTPELLKEAVDVMSQKFGELTKSKTSTQAALTSRIKEIEGKQERIINAIEDGMYNDQIKERAKKLEQEKASLLEQLEDSNADDIQIPSPEVLEECYHMYLDNMLTLVDSKQNPESGFAENIRKMIKQIIATPNKDYSELKIELEGSFAGIVENYTDAQTEEAASDETASTSVVAGACNLLKLHI